MRVIVVIPVLNEERNIINVLRKTYDNLCKNDKILLIDNGSTDNTVYLIRKHFPKLEIVFENKRGKGNAIRKGFEEALQYNSDFIIMIDGDGEKDPGDIPKLIGFAQKTNADLVIGRRNMMRSLSREILRRFENFWINMATDYKISDTSSGFNVIKAQSLKKLNLKSRGFEIEPEIILECRKNGMRVVELPIDVPCISPTRVKKRHVISINRFFDKWVLHWVKSKECNLPQYKKIILKVFCNFGLLIFR